MGSKTGSNQAKIQLKFSFQMGHKIGPKGQVLQVPGWDPLVQVVAVIGWRKQEEKGEGEAAGSYAQAAGKVAGGFRWNEKEQVEVRCAGGLKWLGQCRVRSGGVGSGSWERLLQVEERMQLQAGARRR